MWCMFQRKHSVFRCTMPFHAERKNSEMENETTVECRKARVVRR